MSIKISKISHFSFSFKFNEMKIVPLKNMVLEGGGGITRNIFLEGGKVWSLIVGWKYFQKKWQRKSRRRFVILRETMGAYLNWNGFNYSFMFFLSVILFSYLFFCLLIWRVWSLHLEHHFILIILHFEHQSICPFLCKCCDLDCKTMKTFTQYLTVKLLGNFQQY